MFRQHWGSIEGPSDTSQTSQHYGVDRIKGGPSMGPHHAKRRDPLERPMCYFLVLSTLNKMQYQKGLNCYAVSKRLLYVIPAKTCSTLNLINGVQSSERYCLLSSHCNTSQLTHFQIFSYKVVQYVCKIIVHMCNLLRLQ